MKKALLLLAVFSIIGISKSFSQQNSMESLRLTNINSSIVSRPLIMVDDIETDWECLVLSPHNIESITILKGQSATEKFGSKASDGAIIIKTKPGTTLKKITDFVDASKNINSNVSKIELNGKAITNLNRLLIDASTVTNTSILSDVSMDNNCNEQTVNKLIITTLFASTR